MSVDLTKRPAYSDADVQRMVRAYIDCALWSSTDEDGNPLLDTFETTDLADDSPAWDDCDDFLSYVGQQVRTIDPEQCGHDFWLTRNGHGAGFWDRGLGRLGEALTIAAKTFGSVDLYVGDDSRIHFA
jgi:hypothetical protein